MDALRVWSCDEAQTLRLAADLAAFLRPGSVVAMEGELGAGKTCFVRGLAAALGAEESAISPTFTYENRYRLARMAPWFVHFDLYRVARDEGDDLLRALREAREEGAVIAVEWATAWLAALTPCLQLDIRIQPLGRELVLTPRPPRWKHLDVLAGRWQATAGGTA